MIDIKLPPLSLEKKPNSILNKYGSCLVEFVYHINLLLRGYQSVVGNWIFLASLRPSKHFLRYCNGAFIRSLEVYQIDGGKKKEKNDSPRLPWCDGYSSLSTVVYLRWSTF